MERKTGGINPIEITTIPSYEISESIMNKVAGDLMLKISHLNDIAKLENRDIKAEQRNVNNINFMFKLLGNKNHLPGIRSFEADSAMMYFNGEWMNLPNEIGGESSKKIDFKDIQEIYGIFKGDQAISTSCTQEHTNDWYLAFGLKNRYLVPLDKIKKFTLATYNSRL